MDEKHRSSREVEPDEMTRARLAAIVESSTDAILSITLDGIITSCNQGAERLYRSSAKELIGSSTFLLVPPDRAQEFMGSMKRLQDGEVVEPFDTIRLRGDGSRVHISLNLSPIKDGAGGVIGISHVARDITARKRSEEALREKEERLTAILKTAVEGIITIDECGIVESINPAGCRVFGYGPEEVIGRNVSMLMPSPDRERHDSYLENYLRTGDAKIIGIGREVVGQCKDGSTFPMELYVCEVRLSERRIFTGFVRDISKRRELEQAVEAAGEQERARIARELHDGLGQQLGGLLFLMDGLHRDLQKANAPQKEAAGQLSKELSTALTQARNLAHQLYSVAPHPEGLVEALGNLVERVAAEGAFTCEFTGETSLLVHNRAAASHLYRLAQEAVHNALKHSRATRIEIELARRAGQLELRVRDNGIGLPDQPHSRGLGLLTMQQRARLIGGQLTVGAHGNGGVEVVCSVPISVLGKPSPG